MMMMNSGFLTRILPYRPDSLRLFFTGDLDTYFSQLWYNSVVMLREIALQLCKLVTLMKLSTIIVAAFGLPALLYVFFVLFTDFLKLCYHAQ